jgi:putative acetyltransferase
VNKEQPVEIREELPQDIPAINSINEAAFGRPHEAQLVDELRACKAVICSLVALHEGRPVGHVLFTPVFLHRQSGPITVIAGLGPVAVLPRFQKMRIGSALIEAGIDVCRRARYALVIVLGHPAYYPRFGFQTAAKFDITCAYNVPEDAFMALGLEDGALYRLSGVAHYHPLFDGV